MDKLNASFILSLIWHFVFWLIKRIPCCPGRLVIWHTRKIPAGQLEFSIIEKLIINLIEIVDIYLKQNKTWQRTYWQQLAQVAGAVAHWFIIHIHSNLSYFAPPQPMFSVKYSSEQHCGQRRETSKTEQTATSKMAQGGGREVVRDTEQQVERWAGLGLYSCRGGRIYDKTSNFLSANQPLADWTSWMYNNISACRPVLRGDWCWWY